MAQPSSSQPGAGDNSPGGTPQEQPSQGQPPKGPQAQGGGGPISDLLNQVGGALQHLGQVFAASKAIDPQEKQLMDQIVQMYGQLMSSLSEDSGEQKQSGPPGGAQGQTAPMEAAGNPGATPVQ